MSLLMSLQLLTMNFKTSQPQALSFFLKQIEKNKVSHAYLVTGKTDTLSFAKYMAMSLLCPHEDKGPCEHCTTCERVVNNQHSDVRILENTEGSIKKEDILSLKEYFSQTSFEIEGKKVYILEDVETASTAAMNSILKFLEEPESDIVAILTTAYPGRVLETIQSRCLTISLQETGKESLYQAALDQNCDPLTSVILSEICSSEAELNVMVEDKSFNPLMNLCVDFANDVNKGSVQPALVAMQSRAIKEKIVTKETLPIFMDILIAIYHHREHESMLKLKQNVSDEDALNYVQIFVDIKDRIRPGVNTNLVIDQLCYEITRYHR